MTTIDQNDTNPAPEAPDSAPLAPTGASAPQASPGTPAAASAPVAEGESTLLRNEVSAAVRAIDTALHKQVTDALGDILAAMAKGTHYTAEKAEALLADLRKHLP